MLEAIGREPAGGAARPTSWSWTGHGETQIIVVVIGWMDGEEMWEFLANRVRAMMHYAHVPFEFRYKLFRDCYTTAALNDGLMIVDVNGQFASRFSVLSIFGLGEKPER